MNLPTEMLLQQHLHLTHPVGKSSRGDGVIVTEQRLWCSCSSDCCGLLWLILSLIGVFGKLQKTKTKTTEVCWNNTEAKVLSSAVGLSEL